MRAARTFALGLAECGLLPSIAAVRVELYGSLGATGRGHGSDKAVILGLQGETPEGVDVDAIPRIVARVRETGALSLLGRHEVAFRDADHLHWKRERLPFHSNGMRFAALDASGDERQARVYYSVGGGFVVREDESAGQSPLKPDPTPL